MRITRERAHDILDEFGRHAVRLEFGGKILGEEAFSLAVVSSVDPVVESVTVRLLSDSGSAAWDRTFSLRGARFEWVQPSDPEFAQIAQNGWRSVVIAEYGDGTTLFFAERAS